ncbi:hypothetical protein [Pseudomonas sp. CFBP 13710]|uniref:hypothetical protein n=1 Tax=Pseudomonas sp. CFBP 13710 TaxID=2775311 RepID=UPI001784F48A|nr:hypothetical protein [Pseudomonas sp. CFBP 13710]MBD8730139.1 hypothetical protein [Pseudomonas sp. CFBP 13710]
MTNETSGQQIFDRAIALQQAQTTRPRAMELRRGRFLSCNCWMNQCMNSAIKMMIGIGTPRKNKRIERMAVLLDQRIEVGA